MSLVGCFEDLGSVADRPGRGAHQNFRTEDNMETVWQSVAHDPSVSTCYRSSQLGISRTTLHRILKLDLKMYSYKIQIVETLLPQDHQQRLLYTIRFTQLATQIYFLNNVLMSDKAYFHLNGYVNKQNCRFWGSENPRATHQHQLHPSKCTVWCGVMATRVISPYFFENEDGTPESISGASYRTMIENFLRPMAEQNPNLWF
ncbi:uncharacterized protein LOC136090951 [Hydra vulgaris]|uniref:Uncharacterized protein LOC136090951 n=1 Tax=Hydra vulgaris TaxID=6087 RepID=A0ABM4DHP3_HYDVU